MAGYTHEGGGRRYASPADVNSNAVHSRRWVLAGTRLKRIGRPSRSVRLVLRSRGVRASPSRRHLRIHRRSSVALSTLPRASIWKRLGATSALGARRPSMSLQTQIGLSGCPFAARGPGSARAPASNPRSRTARVLLRFTKQAVESGANSPARPGGTASRRAAAKATR